MNLLEFTLRNSLLLQTVRPEFGIQDSISVGVGNHGNVSHTQTYHFQMGAGADNGFGTCTHCPAYGLYFEYRSRTDEDSPGT